MTLESGVKDFLTPFINATDAALDFQVSNHFYFYFYSLQTTRLPHIVCLYNYLILILVVNKKAEFRSFHILKYRKNITSLRTFFTQFFVSLARYSIGDVSERRSERRAQIRNRLNMSIAPRVLTPTPAATPSRRTLQSNTTALPSVLMEDERDVHITQLQDRLDKMNEIIKKQNIEIKNLREMNLKLFIATKESDTKKKKSNAQSKKYRDAALRMKYKIKSLKSDLLEEQSSTSDQMSFAVDQVGGVGNIFLFFACSSS